MQSESTALLLARIEQLNRIGIALSAERHMPRLLETILLGAKTLTRADGGSIYIVSEDHRQVRLEIMRTDSLDFAMGGTTGREVPGNAIPLYLGDGRPNHQLVVTHAVLRKKTIVIPDIYQADEFDFSGARKFDCKTGYRSRSFLTIPMRNHENDIVGVLQLINAQDDETGEIVAFSDADRHLAESLASQAAVALTNRRLIEEQQNLFDSFVKLIASAIDEKSPHTGAHCERVPVLTRMLAEAAHRHREGPLKDFSLTEQERYELEVASWLHDCGKITTPEHIMDKAAKLETIVDRIHWIRTRFDLVARDARIRMQERIIEDLKGGNAGNTGAHEQRHAKEMEQLEADYAFLEQCNRGGEFMRPEDQDRVRRIGERYRWRDAGGRARSVLTEDEIFNLCVPRGTLNPDERMIVNNHVSATINLLQSLPFPKGLQKVPEYAGSHHEWPNGGGYPNNLSGEQLSIPARILAIADIFEALTNCSRPYKEGMTLSRALGILRHKRDANEIDPDLFDLFVKEKIYLEYARKYLDASQIDEPA
ncbi:MAG TPA: GAF domain-containing protein [Sedimenticola sp.]|nr:GAF domain-containing protein [Sedimenticola sp.]